MPTVSTPIQVPQLSLLGEFSSQEQGCCLLPVLIFKFPFNQQIALEM